MHRNRNASVAWSAAVLVGFAPGALAQNDPPAETPELEVPKEKSIFEGWTGTAGVGINGATGNTERFSVRAEVTGNRKTHLYDTKGSLVYSLASDDGSTSENRFVAQIRNDWIINESRWRVFAEGSATYDEFQDWDWRLTAAGGVAYECIKTEKTTLVGRVGLGASREIGGSDNTIRPEGLIGFDVTHQLTANQKIVAGATYYPDLDEFGEFRLLASAAYEILVDPESKMSLRLGAVDTYDSTPGPGSKKNDLAYFAMLVWEF
ncbi:MAG: DUF481 domain-containing protein [Phycisphaeraceae bacterium]|nr:DUF481 domain-containing protein [Phycisphaeraceae bacterium]